MHLYLSAFGALVALQAFGAHAQEATECSKDINDCLEEAKGDFAGYGCSDINNAECFCNGSLLSGVTTCATSRCPGANQEQISGLLFGAGGFCAGIQPTSSQAVTTSAEDAPTPTEAAAITEALPTSATAETAIPDLTSSMVVPEEPQTTAAVLETTELTTGPSSTAAESTAESSATESASATEESVSGTSVAAGTGASTTSSADEASDSDENEKSSNSGLSNSAKIGVGVGVAAAVLALIGIALCFFMKNRRRQQGQPGRGHKTATSQSLPNGGRYDSRDSGSIGEKNAYDLEIMSNRYEDMLPRQQPRTMV